MIPTEIAMRRAEGARGSRLAARSTRRLRGASRICRGPRRCRGSGLAPLTRRVTDAVVDALIVALKGRREGEWRRDVKVCVRRQRSVGVDCCRLEPRRCASRALATLEVPSELWLPLPPPPPRPAPATHGRRRSAVDGGSRGQTA